MLKDLKQVSIIGLGLLGGSIALAILRRMPKVKVVGYSHRTSTRRRARQLAVASQIVDKLHESVSKADLTVLATPISVFERIFGIIGDALPKGSIVTDVGSTKVLAHRWAANSLPKAIHYVGSHPVAGSEKRGIESARADLFDGAVCILTTTKTTDSHAAQTVRKFWSDLGCSVKLMSPADHDRIFANVSHLPHTVAVALMNATEDEELKLAGQGFVDTSRVASGPSNVWADVLLTNADNIARGMDKLSGELLKLREAIKNQNKKQIENLLTKARRKRARLMKTKQTVRGN
jgi:prephenate dehydrogenase